MVHDKLDIQHWNQVFPLSHLRQQATDFVLGRQAADPASYRDQSAVDKHIELMSPRADSVTSPHDIAVIQQLRDEAKSALQSLPTTDTDVFVFSRGEPARRDITKIGGLPYWPRKAKWPRRFLGKPKTFLAQFCFSDSKDITGALPGDVLLVFGEGGPANNIMSDSLVFLWRSLGETDLVSEPDVPDDCFTVMPCYGTLYRTVDYAANDGGVDRLMAIEGTKIGGVPYWIQYPEPAAGRFLCALGSVQPDCRREYPWLNVRKPITEFQECHSPTMLMWGDAGSLYLYIDSRGNICPVMQCY